MRLINYAVALLTLLLGLSFACLNADAVVLNYYVGQVKAPLSLLLVIVFCGGIFLGVIIGLLKWLKLKRQNAQLTYRIKLVEQEVTNLRVMPLKDHH